MAEDLADLGMAAAAIDPLPSARQPFRLRHPSRGAAFGEAAEIDELHVEAADRSRLRGTCRPAARRRVSQVGCRLMVASSAKISRPRWPGATRRRQRARPGAERRRFRARDDRPALPASRRWRGAGASGRSLLMTASRRTGTREPRRIDSQSIGRHAGACGAMGAAHMRQAWPAIGRDPLSPGCRGPRAAGRAEANHSARAAARRRPFSSIGSFRAASNACTSSRAVTCDRFGRVPSVDLVDVVERGQPAREEFAIDHPLGKAFGGRGSRAAIRAACKPSASSRLLREPSVDSRLRTTIQSVAS